MTAGTAIRKHSVTLAGHRTSVSVEEAFWQELKRLAGLRRTSVTALIEEIDRTRSGNLSSAVRLYVLQQIKAEAAKGADR